jgi:hypothetical protein
LPGPAAWHAAKVDDNPLSLMKPWRHDDEAIAYPTFDAINKAHAQQKGAHPGFNNICVLKGLVNSKERRPEIGHLADLPKAARDWPSLKYGYPEFTEEHKRKILGLNSARLYGIDVPHNLSAHFKPMPADYAAKMSDSLKHLMEMPGYTTDKLAQAKERYVSSGGLPDHTRYGWVRTS